MEKENKIKLSAINDLLSSYWYNRDTTYIRAICKQIIDMILNNYSKYYNDDIDIIYGFLVLAFGEYGTSPRSGWFENDEIKKAIVKEINKFMEEMQIDMED